MKKIEHKHIKGTVICECKECDFHKNIHQCTLNFINMDDDKSDNDVYVDNLKGARPYIKIDKDGCNTWRDKWDYIEAMDR